MEHNLDYGVFIWENSTKRIIMFDPYVMDERNWHPFSLSLVNKKGFVVILSRPSIQNVS